MEGCDESLRGWGPVVENEAREKENKWLLWHSSLCFLSVPWKVGFGDLAMHRTGLWG